MFKTYLKYFILIFIVITLSIHVLGGVCNYFIERIPTESHDIFKDDLGYSEELREVEEELPSHIRKLLSERGYRLNLWSEPKPCLNLSLNGFGSAWGETSNGIISVYVPDTDSSEIFKSTLRHELGHALDECLGEESVSPEILRMFIRYSSSIQSPLDDYSFVDPFEFYADSFSCYLERREELRQNYPDVASYIDSIFENDKTESGYPDLFRSVALCYYRIRVIKAVPAIIFIVIPAMLSAIIIISSSIETEKRKKKNSDAVLQYLTKKKEDKEDD